MLPDMPLVKCNKVVRGFHNNEPHAHTNKWAYASNTWSHPIWLYEMQKGKAHAFLHTQSGWHNVWVTVGVQTKYQGQRQENKMKGRSNTSVPVFHGALRAVQIIHLPSVSHTAKDGDSRLIFQIGKPQRNVSDDPRNTPCSCQSVSKILLLLSVFFCSEFSL